jgi:tRNA G46 methylase TrmB
MVDPGTFALRTFNPSTLIKPSDSGPFPLSESFFQTHSVDLEIGAGAGWHAMTYCKNNPNRTLIAVERTKNKFEKLEQRFLRHPELTNLIPIHADIIPWTVYFLPESSIERIFIYYPNPYPKNPSARFFKMPFFK